MIYLLFSVITLVIGVVFAAWNHDIFYKEVKNYDTWKVRGATEYKNEINGDAIGGYCVVVGVLTALGFVPYIIAALAAPFVGLFLFVRKLRRKEK